MHGTERNIFTNRKFVTICAQHLIRKNGVLQERQIWLGCLSIPL